jgi:hypothetical protein
MQQVDARDSAAMGQIVSNCPSLEDCDIFCAPRQIATSESRGLKARELW